MGWGGGGGGPSVVCTEASQRSRQFLMQRMFSALRGPEGMEAYRVLCLPSLSCICSTSCFASTLPPAQGRRTRACSPAHCRACTLTRHALSESMFTSALQHMLHTHACTRRSHALTLVPAVCIRASASLLLPWCRDGAFLPTARSFRPCREETLLP